MSWDLAASYGPGMTGELIQVLENSGHHIELSDFAIQSKWYVYHDNFETRKQRLRRLGQRARFPPEPNRKVEFFGPDGHLVGFFSTYVPPEF